MNIAHYKNILNYLRFRFFQWFFGLRLLDGVGKGLNDAPRDALVAKSFSPAEGSILLHDRNVRSIPIQKRNIGFVYQHYGLLPHLSVRNNIAYGLRMHDFSEAQLLADRIGIILDGSLKAVVNSENLMYNNYSEDVDIFLGRK